LQQRVPLAEQEQILGHYANEPQELALREELN
jgi:hypothetical protein